MEALRAEMANLETTGAQGSAHVRLQNRHRGLTRAQCAALGFEVERGLRKDNVFRRLMCGRWVRAHGDAVLRARVGEGGGRKGTRGGSQE